MLGEIATDKGSTRRERTSAARALMQASRVELDAIRVARGGAIREYVEAAGCVGGEDRCRTGGSCGRALSGWRGIASSVRSDASPWDWYGGGCPCGRPVGECREHPRARINQRPPDGDWRTWLMLMGRGAGKTRAAAEWVRRRVESGAARRLALVGATAADVRDTMVNGESGLLAISPPWFRAAGTSRPDAG